MKATIIECFTCGGSQLLPEVGRRVTVPGTGNSRCGHRDGQTVEVNAAQLVHVALSTILRHPRTDVSARDAAHTIQEWLKVDDRLRTTHGLPVGLVDRYDVSSTGLAVARIIAATYAKHTDPSRAVYWRAAASLLRVRL